MDPRVKSRMNPNMNNNRMYNSNTNPSPGNNDDNFDDIDLDQEFDFDNQYSASVFDEVMEKAKSQLPGDNPVGSGTAPNAGTGPYGMMGGADPTEFDFDEEFDMEEGLGLGGVTTTPISARERVDRVSFSRDHGGSADDGSDDDLDLEVDDKDEEYGQGSEKGALYDAYNLLHTLAQVSSR